MTQRTHLAGSNHKTAAAWNRGLALRLLRQHGALSRRQIAQMTGLRGSTLTYIVRELLQKNIVRVSGKLDSRGVGQKQVLLTLNPSLGYTIGISIFPKIANVIVVDAGGTRLASTSIDYDATLEHAPQTLKPKIDEWLNTVGHPTGRLLGVGVGLPGVVDTENGQVLFSEQFAAQDVPLKKLVAEQFVEATIVIDNDARLGARAEAMVGAAKSTSHFIYFLLVHYRERGQIRFASFGTALYLEGKLYRGGHYAAGELGGPLMPRRDLVMSESEFERLATPDAELTPQLAELGRVVGKSLATMINLIDVNLVVLGGNCGVTNKEFVRLIDEAIHQALLPVPGRTVTTVPSLVAEEAVARGAAIAVTDAVLESGILLGTEPSARSKAKAH